MYMGRDKVVGNISILIFPVDAKQAIKLVTSHGRLLHPIRGGHARVATAARAVELPTLFDCGGELLMLYAARDRLPVPVHLKARLVHARPSRQGRCLRGLAGSVYCLMIE